MAKPKSCNGHETRYITRPLDSTIRTTKYQGTGIVQLKATLAALEADLADLEESVK